ncbi:beta-glucan synthesis-associated protein [Haematococcus lacustris]|uniref:Beta-glucan synthesis-associated protein n=1 Tax=Haematococcus lacustris TaxID=44745 RepID=A0A699YFI9_HAELA|nr:beta-glucan synthesis-associated protein [Haematococcus lacustris]
MNIMLTVKCWCERLSPTTAAPLPGLWLAAACGGAEGCQTPGVLAIRAVAQSSPLPDSFQAAAAGPTRVTGLGFRSGMVSSWNKLCFTGGYLEVRAKLPGNPQVGGLWPSIWLLGNLARAGYVNSTLGMAAYSAPQCVPDNPTMNQAFDENLV